MAYFRLWVSPMDLFKKEYFYIGLSNEEKQIYEQILKGILRLEKLIKIDSKLNIEEITAVYYKLMNDNPHICYVSNRRVEVVATGFSYKIKIVYLFPLHQCKDIQIGFQKKAEEIVQNLKLDGLEIFEKELSIYEYMTEHLSYDYVAAQNPDKDSVKYSFCAYGAIMNKKAVCQGIAAMFKVLGDIAGIRSILISGTYIKNNEFITQKTHQWNMVRIEEQYVHLDVTNGLNEEGSKKSYGRFNFDDRRALKSYSWRQSEYPQCTTLKFYYYEYLGMMVNSENDLRVYIRRRKSKKCITVCIGEVFPLPKENPQNYIVQIVLQELIKYFGHLKIEYEWNSDDNLLCIHRR